VNITDQWDHLPGDARPRPGLVIAPG